MLQSATMEFPESLKEAAGVPECSSLFYSKGKCALGSTKILSCPIELLVSSISPFLLCFEALVPICKLCGYILYLSWNQKIYGGDPEPGLALSNVK